MKKIISITIALCMVLCSFSFCFAAWSDSQVSSVVSDVSSIKTTLNNIYTRVTSISNSLIDSNHSVAYWASAIASWMSPIYQALTSNLVANLNLEPIVAGLNEVVYSGGNTSYTPYLKYGGKSNANWLSDLFTIDNKNGFEGFNGGASVTIKTLNGNGQEVTNTVNMSNQNWRSNFGAHLNYIEQFLVRGSSFATANFNATQNAVNWGNLGSSSFTPTSATNGIYSWLSAIQAPIARLSYVLASDERIEAQEAAAANEEAVVNNFIDSEGTGSVSASDIGSMAGASDSVKDNFNTGYSSSNVWDIFNSDHYGWFSQECADSLDTTVSNTRTLKSSSGYDTPLLDSYYEQILSLGGDN